MQKSHDLRNMIFGSISLPHGPTGGIQFYITPVLEGPPWVDFGLLKRAKLYTTHTQKLGRVSFVNVHIPMNVTFDTLINFTLARYFKASQF